MQVKPAAQRLAKAQAITSERQAAAKVAADNFDLAAGELAAVNDAIGTADATDDAVLSELARRRAVLEAKRDALRKPMETARTALVEAFGVQGPLETAARKEALEADRDEKVTAVREGEKELIAECEKFLARFQQERERLAEVLLDANRAEGDLIEIRTGVRGGEGNIGHKPMGTILGQVPTGMEPAEAMGVLVHHARVRAEEQLRRSIEERDRHHRDRQHPPRSEQTARPSAPPTHATISTAELELAEISRATGLEN